MEGERTAQDATGGDGLDLTNGGQGNWVQQTYQTQIPRVQYGRSQLAIPGNTPYSVTATSGWNGGTPTMAQSAQLQHTASMQMRSAPLDPRNQYSFPGAPGQGQARPFNLSPSAFQSSAWVPPATPVSIQAPPNQSRTGQYSQSLGYGTTGPQSFANSAHNVTSLSYGPPHPHNLATNHQVSLYGVPQMQNSSTDHQVISYGPLQSQNLTPTHQASPYGSPRVQNSITNHQIGPHGMPQVQNLATNHRIIRHGPPQLQSSATTRQILPSSPAIDIVEQSVLRDKLYPPAGFVGNPSWTGAGRTLYQAHLAEGYDTPPQSLLWLSYIDSLPMRPIVLDENIRLLDGEFQVTQDEFDRVLKQIKQSTRAMTLWKHEQPYSLGYRVRCAKTTKVPPSEGVWVTMATSWPACITINVNGTMIQPRREYHWTVDVPANITSALHVGRNILRIGFLKHPKEQATWSVAVEKVVIEPATDSVRSIQGRVETLEVTRKRIQNHLANSDPDVEILNDYLSLAVTDPISARLIGHPVRSRSCTHLECFDLDTLIESRPGNPTSVIGWKCPICTQDARPKMLYTVAWMKEIVDCLRVKSPRPRFILAERDGSWRAKDNDSYGISGSRKNEQVKEDGIEHRKGAADMVIELD